MGKYKQNMFIYVPNSIKSTGIAIGMMRITHQESEANTGADGHPPGMGGPVLESWQIL